MAQKYRFLMSDFDTDWNLGSPFLKQEIVVIKLMDFEVE